MVEGKRGLLGDLSGWGLFLALVLPAGLAAALFWQLRPEGGWWTALWVLLTGNVFVVVGWLVNLVLRRTILKPAQSDPLAVGTSRGSDDGQGK